MIETRPPETTARSATCKICRKPLIVFAGVCPESDIFRLLPLVTCNRCYDIHDRISRARERAHQTAAVISQIGLVCMDRLNAEKRQKVGDKKKELREALTRTMYSYCAALADRQGLVWTQPVTEIVDMLMEHPEKASAILKAANDHVHRMKA